MLGPTSLRAPLESRCSLSMGSQSGIHQRAGGYRAIAAAPTRVQWPQAPWSMLHAPAKAPPKAKTTEQARSCVFAHMSQLHPLSCMREKANFTESISSAPAWLCAAAVCRERDVPRQLVGPPDDQSLLDRHVEAARRYGATYSLSASLSVLPHPLKCGSSPSWTCIRASAVDKRIAKRCMSLS